MINNDILGAVKNLNQLDGILENISNSWLYSARSYLEIEQGLNVFILILVCWNSFKVC